MIEGVESLATIEQGNSGSIKIIFFSVTCYIGCIAFVAVSSIEKDIKLDALAGILIFILSFLVGGLSSCNEYTTYKVILSDEVNFR